MDKNSYIKPGLQHISSLPQCETTISVPRLDQSLNDLERLVTRAANLADQVADIRIRLFGQFPEEAVNKVPPPPMGGKIATLEKGLALLDEALDRLHEHVAVINSSV